MGDELYTLRYKAGVKGVLTGWIRATSQERAVLVGQAYCNRYINHTFISVDPTIVADESILDAPAPQEADPGMIDDSELPMKSAPKPPHKMSAAPTPAGVAAIRQLDAADEAEDADLDRDAAAREAAEDAKARGRRPDTNPAEAPVAKKK